MNNIQIYADGASRNNPGLASWAYIIVNGGLITNRNAGFIGVASNNSAEYMAVIMALNEAKRLNLKKVEIYSDSELVIKQINGKYSVNQPHLQKLNEQVNRLRTDFKEAKFIYVKRNNAFIEKADKLNNQCLDEYIR